MVSLTSLANRGLQASPGLLLIPKLLVRLLLLKRIFFLVNSRVFHLGLEIKEISTFCVFIFTVDSRRIHNYSIDTWSSKLFHYYNVSSAALCFVVGSRSRTLWTGGNATDVAALSFLF